jgi:3-oxoacyl-[acyl-carrier protein] reductase
MRLEGKVCLVTGGSRGIGAAIVRAYAREGAIAIPTWCTQRAEAEKLAEECGCATPIELDVRHRDSVRGALNEVARRHGRIDVLVNNAGVNRTGDFDQITDEMWDEVLAVDLKGVFLCCQEALPLLPSGGRVINIGSLSGEYGGPRTPSYAAAKAGVMALTHCLARFLGPRGITVNCLSPGVIESDLTAQTMPASLRDKILPTILLGRLGRYEELTGAAVFLASDESSYMTAQTLSVNGGAWVR